MSLFDYACKNKCMTQVADTKGLAVYLDELGIVESADLANCKSDEVKAIAGFLYRIPQRVFLHTMHIPTTLVGPA